MALKNGTAAINSGMQGQYEHTGEGETGVTYVGTNEGSEILDSDEGISFALELDGTYTVELDTTDLSVAITGGSGQPQIETAVLVAAAGATSNGTLNVTVTGSRITGSPLVIPVSITTASHSTETLFGGAIRSALAITAAITNEYTVGGTGANIILTDNENLENDATLNVAWPAGLGASALVSSANTQAGRLPAKCYRLAGATFAGENFQGAALPVPAAFQGVRVRVVTGAGLLVAAGDWEDKLGNVGETSQKHTATGELAAFSAGDTITFTGNGAPTKARVTLLYST